MSVFAPLCPYFIYICQMTLLPTCRLVMKNIREMKLIPALLAHMANWPYLSVKDGQKMPACPIAILPFPQNNCDIVSFSTLKTFCTNVLFRDVQDD